MPISLWKVGGLALAPEFSTAVGDEKNSIPIPKCVDRWGEANGKLSGEYRGDIEIGRNPIDSGKAGGVEAVGREFTGGDENGNSVGSKSADSTGLGDSKTLDAAMIDFIR